MNELAKRINQCCNNAQDAVIPALISEGLKVEEIANLKISNCDFENNTIIIHNNDSNTTRKIIISTEAMDVIKDAYAQEEYSLDKNEEDKYFSKPLNNSEYVVKIGGSAANHQKQPSTTLVQRRLDKLKQKFGFDINDLRSQQNI